MSPPPVRVETNASFVPSGEYIGRVSSAGCETRSLASPPFDGATQMSPPETKAISGRVGHCAGSVRYGVPANADKAQRNSTLGRMEMYGNAVRHPLFMGSPASRQARSNGSRRLMRSSRSAPVLLIVFGMLIGLIAISGIGAVHRARETSRAVSTLNERYRRTDRILNSIA